MAGREFKLQGRSGRAMAVHAAISHPVIGSEVHRPQQPDTATRPIEAAGPPYALAVEGKAATSGIAMSVNTTISIPASSRIDTRMTALLS